MTTSNAGADSRTRDELANERTFLAWLRTAANVMIVGLAIAKFGTGNDVTVWSLGAGAILVLAGGAGALYGATRYRQTSRDLDAGVIWKTERTKGPVMACMILVLAIIVSLALLLLGG